MNLNAVRTCLASRHLLIRDTSQTCDGSSTASIGAEGPSTEQHAPERAAAPHLHACAGWCEAHAPEMAGTAGCVCTQSVRCLSWQAQTTVEDKESGYSAAAVNCYFMAQDGGMFKAQVPFAPYFYLQVKVRALKGSWGGFMSHYPRCLLPVKGPGKHRRSQGCRLS